MKITFTDKNVDIPNRIYSYAEQKFNELDRFFRNEAESALVFSVENGKHILEATVVSGTTIIRVVESTSDMFVTIDAAVTAIERQLRKNRSRLHHEVNPDAFDRDADELIFVPEVDKFEEPAYKLVRAKQFPFRPMSVEEAILQMNLIGHSFFAFRNEERDDAFSVVYRRNDGDYGILIDEL